MKLIAKKTEEVASGVVDQDAGLPQSPADAARMLRDRRRALPGIQEQLSAKMERLRAEDPTLDALMRAVEEVPQQIAALEELLKKTARAQGKTLDLSTFGVRVAYSNPMKESASHVVLLERYPDVRTVAPEVLIERTEVDVKLLRLAVQSGQLPESALGLIIQTPSTSDGRVTLTYR